MARRRRPPGPCRRHDEVEHVDKTALSALPKVSGTPVLLTQAQSDKAAAYLKDNWAKSIG